MQFLWQSVDTNRGAISVTYSRRGNVYRNAIHFLLLLYEPNNKFHTVLLFSDRILVVGWGVGGGFKLANLRFMGGFQDGSVLLMAFLSSGSKG